MKRILSLLLALIMVGSTLVFCSAETEIKVDVRIEDKGETMDMVFSIPENSDLAEFNFEVFYYSVDFSAQYVDEDPFSSNLTAEEEANVEWIINRDMYAGDKDYGTRPRVLVSGYTKDGSGLKEGGDFFTITFTKIHGIREETGFSIVTNFLVTSSGNPYTDATVPSAVTCLVENDQLVDYFVTHEKLIMDVQMDSINDQTKLAAEYSNDNYGAAGRSAGALANAVTRSECTNLDPGNWTGASIPIQPWKAKDEFVRYIKTHVKITSSGAFTFRWRTNVEATNDSSQIVFSNNMNVAASDSAAWHRMDICSFTTMPVASTSQQYYLNYAFTHPNYGGAGEYYINDVSNNRTYMWWGPGLYTMDNQVYCFAVEYDTEAQAFRDAVNALGSSAAATDAYKTLLSTASSKYSALDNANVKNNTRVASLLSTYNTRLNSYNSAVTTAADNWVTSVNNLASGGLTNAEISTLTTLRTNYNNLCSDAKAKSNVKSALTVLTDMENAQSVVSLIKGFTVTWENRTNVINAYNAYNNLASGPKSYVPSNYVTKFTNGKTTIDNMTTAKDNFVAAVAAIGTVDYTADSKALIDDARAKYEVLEAFNDSTLTSTNWATTRLATLEAAEAEYARLESEVTQFKEDVGKLGDITLSDESTITSLLSTYGGFTDGQKAAVATEYATLLAAQSTIQNLKNEVQNVKDLIDACYTVDLDKADEIAAARAAYDALDSEQISLLDEETDYTTKLSSAESELSIIQAKVNDLITRIDGIGEVDLNAEKEALVTELQGIYYGFTDVQKAAVTNADVLTAAADRLEELREGVETFKTLVGNIGEVEITDFATIVEAEGLYANFTDGQKEAVETEYQTLLDAREAIDIILGRIAVVEEEINAFGEVTVDNAIEKAYAITSAKEKYDALLSDDERNEVDNKQTLLDAVAALAEAQARVDAMEAEIEALYPIDIDDGDAIATAETNFAALSESQKGAVENANKLEEARTTYEQMVADVETYKATVNALGVIDLDDQENIELAEELYETFSDLQKDDVAEEEPILTAARTELDALWAEVYGLIDDIDAIGVVTLESEDAIVAARDIYDNELTELQQKAVSNYNVLVDAEIELERLKRQRVTGGIIASNNLSATQTVELVFSGKNAIAGYYFGTSAECGEEDFISYTQNSATAEITQAGTYYLIVKDEYGNLSDTVSVTFVNVVLDANGGTVNITDLLIKQNNYVALPTPSYEGKKFLGWARDINVSYGEKTMVDVENGGTFYAIWEDVNVPTIEVTSTNDVATSQTIIVNTTSEEDLAGYYFGNSANYSENEFVATTNTIYNFPVTEAGTYYVTVKDIYDEVSASFAVTFYKVTLNANGGNSAIPYVITKAGNSVQLPLVTKAGAKFLGWSDDVNATSGVNLVIPSSNETYFAIWSQEISISATVGSVTGAKKGNRIEIPVTMDNYSNAYASVCINKVNYDKSVLSFVTFAIPSNSFISHLSSLPQYNNDTMTYSITNIPSNALNAYFTSGGVIAILVFDVLQDVNQYSEVSVGFDKRNTSVYVNGAMDKWTQTINKLEVAVLSGGVNPIIDNQIPTAFISVTKNMANIQAVTLNMFDNRGIAGYYWGVHAFYEANEYVSGNFTTVNKSIAAAGTYYLTVVDIYGNISTTVLVTLCNIILNVEVDEPSQTIVLLEAGVTIELPVYEKDEHSFRGWATQSDAKIGVESLIVVGDAVYYGIFTNDAEASQDVIALIENIGQVTLESETAIDEARYAYNILSDEQKLMITNYDVLEVAEALYYNLANILLGDTNNSGVVGVEDAVLTLHAAIEKLTLSSEQFKAADIDKDGEITTVDVLYILHIISGKYVEQDVQ